MLARCRSRWMRTSKGLFKKKPAKTDSTKTYNLKNTDNVRFYKTKIIRYNNMVYTKKRKNKQNKTCKNKNIPDADKDITATIDISAIYHNILALKNAAKTDIMPVLKSDAYGHGLLEIAKYIRKIGIKYIAVATLGEAILLRKNGDKGRILSWLYDINGNELKDAMDLDLDIAIFDDLHLPKIKAMIPPHTKLKTTLFIDTGINRVGIPYDNALQAFKEVSMCDKFELVGMMSHLACAYLKNNPAVHKQLHLFRTLRDTLKTIGIIPPLIHIAASDACFNYDVSDFTISRPGYSIFGFDYTNHRNTTLRLPMTLTTRIIQLKEIHKGDGIGYGLTYIAPKKMRIAILPIGYGDIVIHASSRTYVYINGTKRRVLGRISMDQLVVKANDSDQYGDNVFLFGNGKNCPQTIYDIAKYSNLYPLECITHLGYRIHKQYLSNL